MWFTDVRLIIRFCTHYTCNNWYFNSTDLYTFYSHNPEFMGKIQEMKTAATYIVLYSLCKVQMYRRRFGTDVVFFALGTEFIPPKIIPFVKGGKIFWPSDPYWLGDTVCVLLTNACYSYDIEFKLNANNRLFDTKIWNFRIIGKSPRTIYQVNSCKSSRHLPKFQ